VSAGANRVPGGRILLSAFGVRVGGGLVLLRALMAALGGRLSAALLDARIEGMFKLGEEVALRQVRRSFLARFLALAWLARRTAPGDVLLCFNSLPPLWRVRGRVINYVHAPHFVGRHGGAAYTPVTALRIRVERLWFHAGVGNCDEVWVQTPSMAADLLAKYPAATVKVVPFVDDALAARLATAAAQPAPAADAARFSFFYPADAVGHKNHVKLAQAWKLLAGQGLFPRLVLTLRPEEMTAVAGASGVPWQELPAVESLGPVSRERVLELLGSSSALMFASRAETLGLPMLEATALGVPILAAERDFVRDVCTPAQTFDPDSAVSIAMATRRFMGLADGPRQEYLDARGFVERLQA
jgi:glycosyltransferase involved in cell wall biosynthesis